LQPNGKIAINLQPLPIASDKSGFNRRIIQDIMFDVQKFMLNHDMFLSGMNFWDKAPYINNVSWGSYPKPTNIATNTSFEQIYTFVKRGKTRIVNKELQEQSLLSKEEWRHWAVRMIWDDISPVIKINQKGENLFGHGAPFPEDIPYRLIRMHTIEQELVLDPFLGSGTTLKMCRLLNRKGIGYEINPEFRELVQSRILETWDPPQIDSQYKTLSSHDLTEIITQAVRKSINLLQKIIKEPDSQGKFEDEGEDEDIFIRNVTPSIFKVLESKGILTKANIRKIKKNLSNC
jgi:DNA modification methylase